MPDGDSITNGSGLFKLPAFPTQYTAEDVERSRQLEKQRKSMELAYGAKFSREAWSKVPGWEKGIRQAAPTWLLPPIRALPGTIENWEYGFTPEQFEGTMRDVEEEFKDIARRQKVTSLLPNIQAGITIAALRGEPILDTSELLSMFPELRTDFNEDEINYLARFSQTLAKLTPEAILSGDVFAYEQQLPISQEDIEALFPERAKDPRFLLSTVAFSKDLEAISSALQQAYPPEKAEAELPAKTLEELEAWYKQMLIDQGITPPEVLDKGSMEAMHNAIAKRQGQLITLTDTETGELSSAILRGDNSIWKTETDENGVVIREYIIGYLDEGNGNVVPLAPDGTPILNDQVRESKMKDVWDAFVVSFQEMKLSTEQFFTNLLPAKMLQGEASGEYEFFPGITLKTMDEETRKAVEAENKVRVDEYMAQYDLRRVEFLQWLDQNPELKPRPEYEGSAVDKLKNNPRIFLDPGYVGYLMADNAPTVLAYAATIGTAYFTKNTAITAAVASALFAPMESTSIYDDLIENGCPREDAIDAAPMIGSLIASMECIGAVPVAKAINPILSAALRKELIEQGAKAVGRRLAKEGLKTTGKVWLNEVVIEELSQEMVHNAFVKVVNENRSVFENLDEVFIRASISMLPMAGASGFQNYRAMKSLLPTTFQQELDSDEAKFKAAGFPEDQAAQLAYDKLVETETGRAQVVEAYDKAQEQAAPIVNKDITNIEERVSTYNEEIQTIEKSLTIQQDRLQKMIDNKEIPGARMEQRGIVESLKERLEELNKDKVLAQKKLEKTKGRVNNTPVSEGVEEEGEVFTAYRGLRTKGLAATDEGTVGKATYYSSSKEYASTYGNKVQNVEIKLKNPLKINSQAEWDTFREEYIEPLRKQAIRESQGEDWVQQKLREKLISEDYDGVVVAPGILEVGTQIAVFHPKKSVGVIKAKKVVEQESPTQKEAVDSTTVEEATNSASEEVDEGALPRNRRPRVLDWEDEQAGVEEALKDPKIAEAVKISPIIKEARVRAEQVINRLQQELKEAITSGDKETIKEIEGKLKDIAHEAHLSKKSLLGKSWDDLPPDAKVKLGIQAMPNKSLKFGGIKEFLDMEYFMQFLEEMTGAPFYSILVRTEKANAAAITAKEKILQVIVTADIFKEIRSDPVALERVSQEINSRDASQGLESPEGITEHELMLADTIESIYNTYKPIVRYLRVMRTQSTIEEFNKEFPDAVEGGLGYELEMALKVKEEGTKDDLWNYLYDKTWGVINHGFDPRLIASPGLKISRGGGLKTTRGKGRLLRREAIEYPAGKFSKDVLARLGAYVEQMEIQWRIEPEIDTLAEWWEVVGDKFEDWGQVERGLETWLKRVQNMGLEYNWADRVIRRLWRQAMAAVFLEPYMAFRNSFQAMLFHPDRIELARYFLEKGSLPIDLKEQFKIWFDTNISQLGGLNKDWLHVGERGFLVPEAVNRLADSINLYGKSDYYPRLLSASASLNKAHRATNQYLKDGNIKKWIKDSGAIHLRETERGYVISHFLAQANKTFDEGIAGLHQVTGARMAEFYIAKRVADMTHFKYRRSSRGLVEMGTTGSTMWNLIVFSRGYGQRLLFQAAKIKAAFKGEGSWTEARSGFMDIMKLITVSALFGQLFGVLTGRRRNPYDPLNILFGWQFGGLFVGIAQDITIFMGDLATVINPTATEEDKKFAVNRIPQYITRLPETLIPFARRAIDVAETILDKKNIIAYGVRQIRSMIDDKYTPDELEDMDRNLWEKIRKAILGGEVVDPTKLDTSLEKIEDAQARLGTMDIEGRYYTLGDFGSAVSSLTRDIPTVFLTEQEGLTPLVLFYLDCETQWSELFTLPSSQRDDWRREHPLEEAMLLFWEKYSRPVYDVSSPEAKEVQALLFQWFDKYDVDKSMHQWWTNWTLPDEIPMPEE